jgi:hypothetical protein
MSVNRRRWAILLGCAFTSAGLAPLLLVLSYVPTPVPPFKFIRDYKTTRSHLYFGITSGAHAGRVRETRCFLIHRKANLTKEIMAQELARAGYKQVYAAVHSGTWEDGSGHEVGIGPYLLDDRGIPVEPEDPNWSLVYVDRPADSWLNALRAVVMSRYPD